MNNLAMKKKSNLLIFLTESWWLVWISKYL